MKNSKSKKPINRNYKGALIILFSGAIIIMSAMFYDFKIGYIQYQTLEYSGILFIVGFGIGLLIQSVNMQKTLNDALIALKNNSNNEKLDEV